MYRSFILASSTISVSICWKSKEQNQINDPWSDYANSIYCIRCGSRIWSRGGDPASEAESCQRSEAEPCEQSEHSAARVQGLLKGPGSFWVFDAQICILTHSRDSFLLFKTSILTPKVDKNRALDFTSINLRHSDMLHLFFNLHEKLCFNWMTWGMPSEARLKILWHGWWKIDQLCDW